MHVSGLFLKPSTPEQAMIELTRISGVRRSKERVFVLGMLTQPVQTTAIDRDDLIAH